MRVGVVGAGITGLSLTRFLEARGVEVVAVEAADEPGGVIRTTRTDHYLLEHGPQRLRLTDRVRSLVEGIGLQSEVIEADPDLPLFAYHDGELWEVPTSIRAFLTTDLLSWRGKIRLLLEPLTAPGRGEETVAELFARKFGDEAARRLLNPLVGGVFATDPSDMPARYALEPLLDLERAEGSLLRAGLRRRRARGRSPIATFESGLQRLPERLAAVHADRVDFGQPVETITDRANGFALVTGTDRIAVDRVVLTTPAGVAAELLADLDRESAGALARLRYNPLAVVHLRSAVTPRGLGYQLPANAGFHTAGVSWTGPAFGRDGVVAAFIDERGPHALADLDDDRLGRIARREFSAVLDADAAVLDVTRLDPGIPAYDRSWAALESVALPEGIDLATNYTGRVGIPGRIHEAASLAAKLAE